MSKCKKDILIRFRGYRYLTGKQVKRAKSFRASSNAEALELARKTWDPEDFYYPTYLLGDAARKLDGGSISKSIASNAGPEEV